MKSHGFLAVLAAIGMGMVGSSGAAVVEFRNGAGNTFVANYTGAQDSEIYGYGETVSTWNSGGVAGVQIGTGNANQSRKALIRFADLGVMNGQYASINSAKLVLRNLGTAVTSPVNVGAYQISNANADWVEGNTQYAAAAAGEHSWQFKSNPSTAWAGGSGLAGGGLSVAGTDYVATALDTTVVDYSQPGSTLWEWDLPVSLVNQWITGGINGGVVLQKVSEADAPYWAFESSETTAGPRLVIDYNPIPEPAAFGLLVLSGFALRRRG